MSKPRSRTKATPAGSQLSSLPPTPAAKTPAAAKAPLVTPGPAPVLALTPVKPKPRMVLANCPRFCGSTKYTTLSAMGGVGGVVRRFRCKCTCGQVFIRTEHLKQGTR